MTMTQKILADHANLKKVKKGQLIEAKLDLVLGNDITTPVAIKEFEKLNINKVFDESKVAIVLDHFTPNKDIKSAEQCKVARNFANCKNIKNYFDVGDMGIEHCLLPEKGLVSAGDVVIGADSHTCTYGALGLFSTGIGSTDMAAGMATGKAWFKVPGAIKFILKNKPSKWISGKDIILHIIGKIGVDGARYMSMEFAGDGIKYLSMDDRFTICNMAIEAGAKNGIFPVDNITEEYIKNHFMFPTSSISEDRSLRLEKEKGRIPKNKQVYILRPCMIHGPGNKGNLNLLYNVVKKGIPWPLGDFDNRRSFTSIDNLCYVIEGLLNQDVPTGIYHMGDDEALSTNELIGIMCEAMGKKPHIWKMNKRVMEGCAGLGTLMHLPLNTERLRKLTENYVVSNAKIKAALGIDKLPVTAKEGLMKTIRSFEETK